MKTRAALAIPTLLLATFAVFTAACGAGTESVPLDGGADGGPVVILDGGGTPATPPDGPALCPQGPCNYQTNSGCPAAQTCVPVADQSGGVPPTCVPAGQGTSGATCAALDQCAPGFLCAGGQCHKLCCGGDWSGCPSAAEHCVQRISLQNNNGLTVATGAMICVTIDTCDALTPADCPTGGQTCQIIDPTGATFCLPEGSGDIGEACPCKGGSLCVDKQCRRLCKAVEGGGEPYCQEGEGICVHYNRDPEGVGECTPQN